MFKIGEKKAMASFGSIVATIGSILIALGFAWLIAQNWHVIPDFLKVIILVILTASALTAGAILKTHDYEKISASLFMLGSLLYTLSIFLIAQIYATPSGPQGIAWLMLLAFAGVFTIAYLFKSRLVYLIFSVELLTWISIQSMAFFENSIFNSLSVMVIISIFSCTGFLLFILLISKLYDEELSIGYIIAGVIGVGILSSVLSFSFIGGGLLGGLGIFGLLFSFFSIIPYIVFAAFLALILRIKIVRQLIIGDESRNPFIFATSISIVFLWAILFFLNSFLTTYQRISFVILIPILIFALFSYFYKSKGSMVIAMIEFLVWLIIQHSAFYENSNFSYSMGSFALILLAAGALFYGLQLSHKARDHEFYKVYRGFSLLYFLLFSYILTFQLLLPNLWPSGLSVPLGALVFLIVFSLFSLITFITGTISSISNESTKGKEIFAVILAIILLVILILSSNVLTVTTGICSTKTCYDYENKNACEGAAAIVGCIWDEDFEWCSEPSCYDFMDENSCKNAPFLMHCAWSDDSCDIQSCNSFETEESCENAAGYCGWFNNNCAQASSLCYKYDSVSSCNSAPSEMECTWVPTSNNCLTNKTSAGCDIYNNDRTSCVANSKCTWEASSYYSRPSEVPTSLWILWIFANIIFIFIILSVIGYGTYHSSPAIINLGITFFALDIFTRYIGFIMDFWGYTTLSILFISGGIILIFGGWLVEKWRRKLVVKARAIQQ